jgi:hypothetical protein
LWPYALAGVALAIPLAASAKRSDAAVPDVPLTERRRKMRCAFSATGLGDDWLRFFEQTAKRESDFSPRAWNKSSGERAASVRLNERVGVVDGIDFASGAWGFGSKGLFQFLGAVVAVRGGQLRFPREWTNPNMGFDPGTSMAAALDYATGLMGWQSFAGTWASLSVGWGNPSKMGNASSLASAAKKMEDRAAKLGWPRGWAGQRVPAVRRLTQSEIASLAHTATSYWEGC